MPWSLLSTPGMHFKLQAHLGIKLPTKQKNARLDSHQHAFFLIPCIHISQQNDTAHMHLPKCTLNHNIRTVNLPSIQDSFLEHRFSRVTVQATKTCIYLQKQYKPLGIVRTHSENSLLRQNVNDGGQSDVFKDISFHKYILNTCTRVQHCQQSTFKLT